ncbi:MAG: hypothetical protein JWQ36_2940 [Enterovirga sp.]|jgi:hypothetical protein|nr:hypothetical protein [Enterovirga sp.]
MLQDLIAALVSTLLIQPLQTEVRERLEGAQVPSAVITDVMSCARGAAPAAIARASADPVWAVSSAVRVWIGTTRPEALLLDVAPGCAPAISAARPFLEGRPDGRAA